MRNKKKGKKDKNGGKKQGLIPGLGTPTPNQKTLILSSAKQAGKNKRRIK